MSLLTVPNVFTNGTGPANIIDAVQMNANFTAVATAVNNIYPSQILPITTAQATFGATATGVGYKFLANDATATPLTVSGVAGQSADIFDVTLTSGGTKTFSILAGGQTLLGVASTTNADFLRINSTSTVTGIGTSGATVGGVTGGALLIDTVGVTNLMALSTIGDFAVARSVFAGGGNAPNAGSLVSAVSSTTGQVIFGGTFASATGAGALAFDGSKYNFFSAGLGGSTANIVASTGMYNATSDARLKKDIAVIPYGLAEVLKMKPSKFKWIADDTSSAGFIAQELQQIIPEAVSVIDDKSGMLGIGYTSLIPVLTKAIQELSEEVRAISLRVQG